MSLLPSVILPRASTWILSGWIHPTVPAWRCDGSQMSVLPSDSRNQSSTSRNQSDYLVR